MNPVGREGWEPGVGPGRDDEAVEGKLASVHVQHAAMKVKLLRAGG
jgi:hypothetical protein